MNSGTLAEPSRAPSSERVGELHDGVLERAFACREAWALDGVYARYHSLLYSVAFNVLRNAEDAQDCVHDALIKVWTKRVAYEAQRGALRSFLVVCVRKAVSQQRTAARLAKLSARAREAPTVADEIRIEDHVESSRLLAAFLTLPEEQRAPLILSYFIGMTHVEIARELGLSLGTAKSRISLGLRRLGKALSARI